MQWLDENEDASLEFVRQAYAKDKRDTVIKYFFSFSSNSNKV